MAVSGHLSIGILNADEFPNKPNLWWLARLKVDDRYKGCGIGSKLLKEAYAVLGDIPKFKGLVVAPGGYGSDVGELFKFYKSKGFVDYEQDALVWKKPKP